MTNAKRLLGTFAALVVVVTACGVGEVSLVGKHCPCATDQGYGCDLSTNTCVPIGSLTTAACNAAGCACTGDGDCHGATAPKCIDGACGGCSIAPDSCPTGTYCVDGNSCAPGCKSDQDCATLSPSSPFCDPTRHQCLQCTQQSDCKDGLHCSPSGACAIACDADAAVNPCPAGNKCCGGLCIDPTSDVLNCASCGNQCTGADTLCCDSTCTDPLTTTTNCGACGFSCSNVNNTPSCSGGKCSYACTGGYGHCGTGNTGCETPNPSSLNQCGAGCVDCSVAIQHASGAACTSGSCTYGTCNAGYADCNGKASDGCECHCGGPNQVCCPGNVCSFGTCNTTTHRCPDD